MQQEYRTVLRTSQGEYVEKKSKFIATISYVESEKDSLEIIQRIKTENFNARHNCYAYSLYGCPALQKYSDDGEPQGTAGLPILEVIKKNRLQNVVIVVTRYFGGILLGSSGLLRAYTKAAQAAVAASVIVNKKLCVEMSVKVDYCMYGKIMNYLKSKNITIKKIDYLQQVEIVLYLIEADVFDFKKQIMDISNGEASFKEGEKSFVLFTENKD